MTVKMSKSSTKRQQGWVYSQFYTKTKDIYDAASTKPFQSPFLQKLAFDSTMRAMVDQEGGAVTTTTARLKGSFLDSKIRIANGLHECKNKSYRVREEHRVSFAFFYRIKTALEAVDCWDGLIEVSKMAQPYWQLSTTTYSSYLSCNLNKFLFAFESVLSWNKDGHVDYEHCKILQLLLHSIQHCYDSIDLQRIPGLWKDRWEPKCTKDVVHGMGLQATMKESGYGWYLPKIDWDSLQFHADFADQMIYNNERLSSGHRRRWLAVKNAKADIKGIAIAGKWLEAYQSSKRITEFILRYLASLIRRQFRKNVFCLIKNNIQPEHQSAVLAGNVILCWESLKEVLIPEEDRSGNEEVPIRIQGANRTKIRTIEELTNFLWDYDDRETRGQWEKHSYRLFYQRAMGIVQNSVGDATADMLQQLVKRSFVLTTWIVPLPTREKFWPMRKGIRGCLSLYHADLLDPEHEGEHITFERLLDTMDDQPGKGTREFMYQWDLEAQKQQDRRMTSVPDEDSSPLFQPDVSLDAIGGFLEELWEEESSVSPGA